MLLTGFTLTFDEIGGQEWIFDRALHQIEHALQNCEEKTIHAGRKMSRLFILIVAIVTYSHRHSHSHEFDYLAVSDEIKILVHFISFPVDFQHCQAFVRFNKLIFQRMTKQNVVIIHGKLDE